MVDNSYLALIDKAAALDAKIKAETMELNQIKEIIKAAIEVGELPVGKTPTKKHVLTVSAIKTTKILTQQMFYPHWWKAGSRLFSTIFLRLATPILKMPLGRKQINSDRRM